MVGKMKTPVVLSLVAFAIVVSGAFAAADPAVAPVPGAGSHPVIPLWPAGAPGSEARKDEPEKVVGNNVTNIHFPTLTLYLPAKDQNTGCAVVVCPGGGHRFLVMPKEGYDVAQWLAAHGIVALVLKNRLARDDANPADTPQPYTIERDSLADAQRAIRLVRSRAAEWGIDPARVGIIGFSAGGELAALAAMRSDAGQAQAADPIDRFSSRPGFQGLIYPGQSQKISPAPGAPRRSSRAAPTTGPTSARACRWSICSSRKRACRSNCISTPVSATASACVPVQPLAGRTVFASGW
jgi:acetyl esterase/lipase